MKILEKINLNRYKNIDHSLDILSSSSDYIGIAVPLIEFGRGLILQDASIKNKALDLGIGLLGTYAVGYGLKKAVDRPRPYTKNLKLENFKVENDSSFPSGSTALAFNTATGLSLAYKKWYVIAPAFAYASGVGYARMHLGVHYPSDVLAGAAIGTASAIISRKLNKLVRNGVRKRKIKHEK